MTKPAASASTAPTATPPSRYDCQAISIATRQGALSASHEARAESCWVTRQSCVIEHENLPPVPYD